MSDPTASAPSAICSISRRPHMSAKRLMIGTDTAPTSRVEVSSQVVWVVDAPMSREMVGSTGRISVWVSAAMSAPSPMAAISQVGARRGRRRG